MSSGHCGFCKANRRQSSGSGEIPSGEGSRTRHGPSLTAGVSPIPSHKRRQQNRRGVSGRSSVGKWTWRQVRPGRMPRRNDGHVFLFPDPCKPVSLPPAAFGERLRAARWGKYFVAAGAREDASLATRTLAVDATHCVQTRQRGRWFPRLARYVPWACVC